MEDAWSSDSESKSKVNMRYSFWTWVRRNSISKIVFLKKFHYLVFKHAYLGRYLRLELFCVCLFVCLLICFIFVPHPEVHAWVGLVALGTLKGARDRIQV